MTTTTPRRWPVTFAALIAALAVLIGGLIDAEREVERLKARIAAYEGRRI